MDELSDLYAEVIMDHQRHPRNFGKLEKFDKEVQMTNSSCGDRISIQIKFDGEKVEDLKFSGMGCTISMASASVMTEVMKGLSIEDVKRLSQEFIDMIKEGKTPVDDLKEAKVFSGVHKYPMRVKCATLAWHAIQKAVE